LRAARPKSPGRLQEVLGDQHPSEMITAPSGVQNPAYNPLQFFYDNHTSMKPTAAAIIPAAGFGTRMGSAEPKQYLLLGGKPILIHTVEAFLNNTNIADIIVVVPTDRLAQTKELLEEYQLNSSSIQIIAGGRRRQDSVYNGLNSIAEGHDIVLVHDGARPLITQKVINRCCDGARNSGAVIAAVPVKDTLKKGDDGKVGATVDRNGLYQAQTPQAARINLLKKGYEANGDRDVTDESTLLERAGIPVGIVDGSETNLKVTRPEDLVLAETIYSKKLTTMRIGHGFDAHKFAEDRELVLGGRTIPHSHGLAGHSDADVLTHALCDAILGGLGQGDIGKHFPDSDAAFKDIYSIELLKEVIKSATELGYSLGNADITVICQAPKLAPHIDGMKTLLAEVCNCAPEALNIKATTTEKMGFTGRKEGISCHAVVLLNRL